MQITILGNASKKKNTLKDISEEELQCSLLIFLTKRGLPISHSCRGEQVCKKCIINSDLLSCSITTAQYIKTYGNKINIGYL